MNRKYTESDMGCIKIYNEGMSCFFQNGFGDSRNTVKIYPEGTKKRHNFKFLGHFTVKDEAFLSEYDCADEPIYKFEKGRWFVNLEEPLKFIISKVDEETHS